MLLPLLVYVRIFPADAPFNDCNVTLSYQLKYSHMNRSRETILKVQERLQYLGYIRARAGFHAGSHDSSQGIRWSISRLCSTSYVYSCLHVCCLWLDESSPVVEATGVVWVHSFSFWIRAWGWHNYYTFLIVCTIARLKCIHHYQQDTLPASDYLRTTPRKRSLCGSLESPDTWSRKGKSSDHKCMLYSTCTPKSS